MSRFTDQQLDNWFTYHSDPEDVPKYVEVREAAKVLAKVIVANCPPSADLSAAMRKLRETVMTANAAIACKGQ